MAKTEPFDEHASEYEEWFVRNKLAYESELQAIREHLPKSGKGIEIGVGSGRFAAPLGVWLGVEPSAKMGEIAKGRGIHVIRAVAEALPFAASAFDFALLVTTICFVDDIRATFREALRVLKSGGYLIVGFIDRNTPLGKLYEQRKQESTFYRVAKFYSAEEVISLLRGAGFGGFDFSQTIFHNLPDIKGVEPTQAGYGAGSFAVIKAVKG